MTAVLALTSCNGGSSLSTQQLTGTWKGQTTTMPQSKKESKQKGGKDARPDSNDKTEMSWTPTLNFIRADGTKGGRLEISSDYTFTQGVESVTSKVPVNASIEGSVTASGTWIVEDGDDIKVMIDASKTKVDVDTASLTLNYANVTDAPKDSLELMRERVMTNIADVVKPIVAQKIQTLREFEDVSVTDNIMTLEINDNMITFTKQ